MTITYRISSNGYTKRKLPNINNANCLINAWSVFTDCDWHIIIDNLKEDDEAFTIIKQLERHSNISIDYVNKGSGAQTFNVALDYALTLPSDEIVYFLENDYLHLPGSKEILEDILNLGASFATAYLHPDKFLSPSQGGNPEVGDDGGYATKIYQGEKGLYFLVNSTTMTFAAKVETLKRTESILREYTIGTYPRDYELFLKLREVGESLLCPVQSYSTHGEVAWAAPFVEWSKI